VRTVGPAFPWETPVSSTAFVAGALARARPAERARRTMRIGGQPETVVAESYAVLRGLVLARCAGDASTSDRLLELERREPGAPWVLWQSALARAGADDDPDVLEAARVAWEALGPNTYRLALAPRPERTDGFLTGRLWLTLGPVAGAVILVVGLELEVRLGPLWWLSVPVLALWLVSVVRVLARRRRARGRTGARRAPR
jgi:hypothetical protein